MSRTGQPHDRFFRRIFSRPDAASSLVRAYLPPEVVERLVVESLEVRGDSYVDAQHREHISDAVYRVRLRESGGAWVYVLVEHKSGVDRVVAVQLLRYVTAVWERHLRERGGLPLPVVIPLVIHHGPRPWRGGTELAELVQASPELAHFVPRLRYLLVDLRAIADEEVRGEPIVRMALLAMRHVFDQHLGRQAVQILREVHAVENADARRELMKSLVDYLSNARDQVERRELEDAVRQVFRGAEGEEIMVTIAEAWMRDGALAQARKDVLKAAQLRFRELPPGLDGRVHAVEDIEMLEQLLQAAITGESVEAFQREVEVALSEDRSPASPE